MALAGSADAGLFSQRCVPEPPPRLPSVLLRFGRRNLQRAAPAAAHPPARRRSQAHASSCGSLSRKWRAFLLKGGGRGGASRNTIANRLRSPHCPLPLSLCHCSAAALCHACGVLDEPLTPPDPHRATHRVLHQNAPVNSVGTDQTGTVNPQHLAFVQQNNANYETQKQAIQANCAKLQQADQQALQDATTSEAQQAAQEQASSDQQNCQQELLALKAQTKAQNTGAQNWVGNVNWQNINWPSQQQQ